ncbi:NAD-dependent epimerase/dehydratase family protein [Flavobacterium sp. H122]|uniref:NAD-dependent epimerase/dehydratase family protein n=1 Tax=Flavobacterium sp. H122 TaxID=2529860 RepID=UPI0010A9C76A|nr:NAD-dependent epimerase/dehydratase family protein [Flavobacterium sp. H122]
MILVTGATGLVGSHLVLRLLERGKAVKAIYRSENNKDRVQRVFEYYQKADLFAKINWFKADITDVPELETAFQNIEFVYHCAALVSFDPSEEENLRKINIEGTANVVNLCIAYNIKKLCYVSSIAALGDLKDFETMVTEETEWNPEALHSDYGISKYGAEMEVWRGYQEGLAVVIVNPGVILGPLFWREGSGDIYEKVKAEVPFYTNGGTGFVSVIDVVAVMLLLMDSEITGERFILVAETKAYREMADLIAEKTGVRKPEYEAKKWMTSIAWRIDWFLGLFGKNRILSKDIARTLHTTKYFDVSKVRNAVSYEFEPISKYIEKLSRS